jgi:hypothetical protein
MNMKATKAKKLLWIVIPSLTSFYSQVLAMPYTNAIGDALNPADQRNQAVRKYFE